MLSANELTSMQAVVLRALDQVATVTRTARAPDGAGGYSESWAGASTVYATMPCRARRVGSIEGVIAEQIAGKLRMQLLFPQSYTLVHKDRVTIGAATYQLLSNPKNTSYGFLLGVEIEQIEEQG